MPASYAHYRFGAQVIDTLPQEVRSIVRKHRDLFDVGVHGPDFLFYYRPLQKTPLRKLGSAFHHQPGTEFFGNACRRLRLKPSEDGIAYLYGVLAHFSLDSLCHPMICGNTNDGSLSHTALESEFDRYLLELDGKPKPYSVDLSKHMRLTRAQSVTVAGFYPSVTPEQVQESVRSMYRLTKITAVSNLRVRKIVHRIMDATGKSNGGLVMQEGVDTAHAFLDAPLLELYEQARAQYPLLAQQLNRHMICNAPFGAEFQVDFG